MVTLNLSAGVMFALGVVAGVIASAIGLVIAAVIASKKK